MQIKRTQYFATILQEERNILQDSSKKNSIVLSWVISRNILQNLELIDH